MDVSGAANILLFAEIVMTVARKYYTYILQFSAKNIPIIIRLYVFC